MQLMSIVSKKGDRGETWYFDKRVRKDSELMEAVGSLDELQAVCGLVKLEKIQKDLYWIMGNLGEKKPVSVPQRRDFDVARPDSVNFDVARLETRIREIEKEIEMMETKIKVPREFVIFKKEKAVKLNWVRTVVRRAERAIVKLETRNQKPDKGVMIYLNRLSDFIYLKALQEELK